MAKKDSVEDQFDQVFDVMPGAEYDTEEIESVDMNFGLGEGAEEEETEETEQPEAAEAEEEPVVAEENTEETAEETAEKRNQRRKSQLQKLSPNLNRSQSLK